MGLRLSVFVNILLLLCVITGPYNCLGQTHSDVMALFRDKLDSANYHTDVRPINNQSEVTMVGVTFEILSIVEIDDVSQSFTCNGVFQFSWKDEVIAWDPNLYGQMKLIHPKPKDIWRPRVVLMNTLGDRDIFDDDYAPVIMSNDGVTLWIPGSLFTTSCDLDMVNYPFDEQRCSILMMSMGWQDTEVLFKANYDQVQKNFYQNNGEWELVNSSVEIRYVLSDGQKYSSFAVSFHIKRDPAFLLITMVLPVVFLSFLNLFVFLIPVESGEKISFGTTVLLALTVFLSIISGSLPRASADSMPKAAIYLFLMLMLSLLAVIDTIIIVYLHHMEEKETRHQRAKDNLQKAVKTVTSHRHAILENGTRHPRLADVALAFNSKFPHSSPPSELSEPTKTQENGESCNKPKVNKYKLIGKHIDFVSFVIFMFIWISMTIGFLIDMAM